MPIVSYDDLKEKKGKIMHSLIDLAGIVDNLNGFNHKRFCSFRFKEKIRK